MLVIKGIQESRAEMNEPGQGAAATGAAGGLLISGGLFIVERRLPKIDDHQLAVLQAALTAAAGRFSARGDGVRYLRSIFLARQERLSRCSWRTASKRSGRLTRLRWSRSSASSPPLKRVRVAVNGDGTIAGRGDRAPGGPPSDEAWSI